MDFLPAQVLFARSRVGASVSSTVSRLSPEGLRRRRLAVLFLAGIPSDARRLLASHRAYPEEGLVVYAKRPFAGPEQVLKYVARYTHRIAISNNRLLDIDDGKVQFRWKD